MCPYACLTRNMLTHNRDFSPVQTNQCHAAQRCVPGRALLKQHPGKKPSPRDKSGDRQTNGDLVPQQTKAFVPRPHFMRL